MIHHSSTHKNLQSQFETKASESVASYQLSFAFKQITSQISQHKI